MADMVRSFALRLVRRLQKPSSPTPAVPKDIDGIEDGEMPQEQEDRIQTPYLPDQLALPAQKSEVLQHVELIFSLSVKSREFLDEYVPFMI